jgi:hypothetical protein
VCTSFPAFTPPRTSTFIEQVYYDDYNRLFTCHHIATCRYITQFRLDNTPTHQTHNITTMFARVATRVPITAAFAGKRIAPATIRANSSSSTSSAARVMEMAAQAERPSTSWKGTIADEQLTNNSLAGAEAAVPVMWAACGVLTYALWNRMSERSAGENVEKLLIV